MLKQYAPTYFLFQKRTAGKIAIQLKFMDFKKKMKLIYLCWINPKFTFALFKVEYRTAAQFYANFQINES